jgi:hypothetical protein
VTPPPANALAATPAATVRRMKNTTLRAFDNELRGFDHWFDLFRQISLRRDRRGFCGGY